MTLSEFYKKLEHLIQSGWKARCKHKSIQLIHPQNQEELFCPITALCLHETGNFHSIVSYREAGKKIKLPYHRIKTIQNSVDDIGKRNRICVRKEIKRICGIDT